MLHVHIITLFPDSIRPYLENSIIGRAQKAKKIKVSYYNPIDFTGVKIGKLARLDWRPYGGGPGMVLRPEPILKAAQKAIGKKRGAEKIFFSTDGDLFDEAMAKKLAKKNDILLICGRYEGVDERVPKILKAKKISMGPFVLTGGELPAATVIDAIARFVPGVLGNENSLENLRKATHAKKDQEMLASPESYTRPEVLEWKKKKYRVPKVLLTGNHAKIEEWKKRREK